MMDKYNMDSASLQVFLEKVKDRVNDCNWEFITTVPDVTNTNRDLLTTYSLITKDEIRAHATTYIATNTRNAQDSMMFLRFLHGSLTDKARSIVSQLKAEYTVNNVQSGAMLLKFIIGRAIVDTIATVHVLRKSISTLSSKMTELGSNIEVFNNHVLEIQNSLVIRGETTNELLFHVFEAYLNASSTDFVLFMKLQRSAFEMGGTNLTVEQLMTTALTHYELRVQDGTWEAVDPKEEKIMAMQAQLDSLKKKKKKKGKRDGEPATSDSGKPRYEKPAWKKLQPKPNDAKKKTVDGKEYHWCTKHAEWTRHKSEDCRLPEKGDDKDGKTESAKESKQGLIPTAQASLVEDYGSDSQEE
jgi:hypothetical protein